MEKKKKTKGKMTLMHPVEKLKKNISFYREKIYFLFKITDEWFLVFRTNGTFNFKCKQKKYWIKVDERQEI